MQLLLALNEGVKSLGSRFDTYQTKVDDKFMKLQSEMTLLKNKVEMIDKAQQSGQSQR